MRNLTISLTDELYRELEIAAAVTSREDGPHKILTAQAFAKECVESVLAERRLDRIDRQRMAEVS